MGRTDPQTLASPGLPFRSIVYLVTDTGLYWRALNTVTSVGERVVPDVPAVYTLGQNYPNPFNPSTTIRYGMPERAHVSLAVYNTLGQQVATLVQGEQEAGYHEARFDASGLASGVYLFRLQAGSYMQTRKLCLVR